MGNGGGRITVMTLRGLQKMFGFQRLLGSRRPNECPKYKHQLAYRSCPQGSTIVSPHLAQCPLRPTSITIQHSTGRYQLKGRQSRWVMNGLCDELFTAIVSSPTMESAAPTPPSQLQ